MITLEEANSLDFERFTEVFGNIIEHCPVIAAGVWSHHPFATIEELRKVFDQLIDSLPYDSKYFFPFSIRFHTGVSLAIMIQSAKGRTVVGSEKVSSQVGVYYL